MEEVSQRQQLERRIKRRHDTEQLQVVAAQKGFLGFYRQSHKVECFDFNRYGMAIGFPGKLKVGDRLTFSFTAKYVNEKSITGRVANIDFDDDQSDRYCRVGISFDCWVSEKNYDRAVDNALARIERIFSESSQQPDKPEPAET